MDVEAIHAAKQEAIRESHRVTSGASALMIIDMQHGFLDPGASLEVPKGREVVPNVQRLLAAWRAAKLPVIFTEFVYSTTIPCLRGTPFGPEHLPQPAGATTGLGMPSANCLIGEHAGQGVEASATVEALAPQVGELVVQAHTYDKLYGTPVELALQTWGIERLVVTGVTTDVCVNSTILSAANRNYRVVAVTDGMATIHDHIHQACLDIWANKFARLVTTDEIVAEVNTLCDSP